MLDPRFPWLAIGALSVVTGVATVYYAAIITGLYKDPLLSDCRMYGHESQYFPICRFLYALGAWSLLVASMLDSMTQTINPLANVSYLPLIFFLLSMAALIASAFVRRSHRLRIALPRWYAHLLRDTTRLERRLIAFAWLRLPRGMRRRLNSDQASWRVWTDMVRITVTYGAQEPEQANLPPWIR